MADLELTTDATVPTNTSLTVTVYEDIDADGTAENTASQSISGGTNTYTLSGFDASSGNDVWVQAEPDSTDVTTTASINSVDVQIAVSAPSQPQNVSLTVDSNDQITVTWDEVSDWGGETGSYEIEMSRDGAAYVSPSGGATSVSGGSSSYSETYGPNSDNSYDSQVGIDSSFQFRVRATNSAGSSSWVETGTGYTDPIPPHDLSVSRSGGSSITISWTNQSDVENGVEIQYREGSGSGYGAWTTQTTTSVGATSWNTSSLPDDVRRQWRVRTVSSDGDSSEWVYTDYGNNGNVYFEDDFESGDLSAWDSVEQDALVESDSGIDSGFSGADEGTYYVQLDDGGRIEKNLGDLSGESDVIVKCAMAAGSMDSSAEYADLEWYNGSSWTNLRTLGHEYNKQGWVEVTALVPSADLSTDNRIAFDQEGGGGDYTYVDRVIVSDILHEYTTPAAPTNLQLDTTVEDEITAMWTDNATFEDNYDLDSKQSSESTWSSVDAYATSPVTETGLPDGEEYDYRVRSWVNQYRHGVDNQNFESSFISTTAATYLPPSTSLSASNIGPDSADLSWTNNEDNATEKRVYLRETGGESGMDFNGDDYIEVGTPTVLDIDQSDSTGDSYTFSAWCKLDDGATNKNSILSTDTGGWDWGILSNEGTARIANGDSDINSGVDIQGEWHHLVGVFNKNQDSAILYVDGVEKSNATLFYDSDYTYPDIGRNPSYGNYFSGLINNVRIYNRALSSTEVTDTYNGNPPSNGLVGYWPLDINRSGTTPDLSPQSNDGTVNGATLTGPTVSLDQTLAASANSASLSELLNGEEYEAYLHTLTDHNEVRDT